MQTPRGVRILRMGPPIARHVPPFAWNRSHEGVVVHDGRRRGRGNLGRASLVGEDSVVHSSIHNPTRENKPGAETGDVAVGDHDQRVSG